MPIAGACIRCGTFYCIECVPDAARQPKSLCPACESTREEREAPAQLASIIRELWISIWVLGGLCFALIQVFQVSTQLEGVARLSHAPLSMVRGLIVWLGILSALPFVVTGGLLAATGRTLFAWMALVLEAVVLGGVLLFTARMSVTTVICVAVPLYTLARVLRLRQLRRIVAHGPLRGPGAP
jgi:hypothetical protein